ncbi:hypothetical protein GCM10010912_11800 [Paenibacillus albidus]|uniref:DUF4367 domain-containing protein n=1 Tax=Paenibacillus albidus TaxID=2041023 RepID=A0A917C344_9BACL|nr:hypothetical protein [Paenibacillus albidus]GGF68402.1 hypothetical protein GCM10010912_11800 [Paenibacillus albidus]
MSNNSAEHKEEQRKTDEAWSRLQNKLGEETMHPKWAEWEQGMTLASASVANGNTASAPGPQATEPLPLTATMQTDPTRVKAGRARRRKMSRSRKWATAAAGLAVFAVILSTPVGNTAMAAILGQFRMEKVTVVQEDDLRNMFYQIDSNGNINETVNAYGTFTSASGTFGGEVKADQLKDKLGYPVIHAALNNQSQVLNVSPSREITLNLNVSKVNETMQRLGAKELLPESVDGKPLTLQTPEIVYYDLTTEDGKWSSLSQMKTPTLQVDPSIEIEEALKAVVNFPLLPDYLKSSLEQSSVLSGELPMPIFAGKDAEQLEIAGTTVILDQKEYGDSVTFEAVWIRDGLMYNLSGGNRFATKENIIAKVQELIQS